MKIKDEIFDVIKLLDQFGLQDLSAELHNLLSGAENRLNKDEYFQIDTVFDRMPPLSDDDQADIVIKFLKLRLIEPVYRVEEAERIFQKLQIGDAPVATHVQVGDVSVEIFPRNVRLAARELDAFLPQLRASL